MTDSVLRENDLGYFDISFTESGDIKTSDFFDTAIFMSIFDEFRADESEVPIPNLRRGWIGNETKEGFQQGSKQWQFMQERVTGSSLLELRSVIKKGMQWMTDDALAEKITVETPFLKNGIVQVKITIERSHSQPESKLYQIWDNTGDR